MTKQICLSLEPLWEYILYALNSVFNMATFHLKVYAFTYLYMAHFLSTQLHDIVVDLSVFNIRQNSYT